MERGIRDILSFMLLACILAPKVGKATLEKEPKELYIAGLIPSTSSWGGGGAMLKAIELALDHINNRSDILTGYHLKLIYNDTQFNEYDAIHLLYRMMTERPVKIVVIGAIKSEVSQATALVSSLWNLVQISPASVTPYLSNKKTYPRFFRTSCPETVVNPARIQLLKHFNWRKVATVRQSRSVFAEAMKDLQLRLEEANITILASEMYQENPASSIENIKKSNARIILAMTGTGTSRRLMCEAYKAGLYGRKYVWMMPDWFDSGWWKTDLHTHDCTLREMDTVTEGYLYTGAATYNPNEGKGVSGFTPAEYKYLFDLKTDFSNPYGTKLAPQGYDAMWAIALALNITADKLRRSGNLGKLEDFQYNDTVLADLILESMKEVRFEGVKSPYGFDENHDPTLMITVGSFKGGRRNDVGVYNPFKGVIEWSKDKKFVWHNGAPPRDSTVITLKKVYVSILLYIFMCSLASFAIAAAIFFLVINVAFRNTRIIKMSSPNMNNIILVGCIIVYSTVFFQERHTAQIISFYKARCYTFVVGFALAFGALFAKTWRIHVVFANKNLKKKVVKDTQLYIHVIVLLVIDLCVLIAWEIIDPVRVREIQIGARDLPGGNLELSMVELCDSAYRLYFVASLYTIQGLVLIFGAFLAWETRKVKIPALNDSQYIGMCIYNVVLLCVLGAIMAFVLGKKIEMYYGLISGLLIFGTTATQFIIFIPKLIRLKEIQVSPEEEDAYTTSTFRTQQAATIHRTNTEITTVEYESKIIKLQDELLCAKQLLRQKEEHIKQLEASAKQGKSSK